MFTRSRRIQRDAMARLVPPSDWHALRTDADWKAYRGGVLVVHQRSPIGREPATKYHGRNCRFVQHGVFRARISRGTDNSEWFRAPNAASAKRGGAVPCEHCSGE
jgi:hypothetical protein